MSNSTDKLFDLLLDLLEERLLERILRRLEQRERPVSSPEPVAPAEYDFSDDDFDPSWFTHGGSSCDLCGGAVIDSRCSNCMFDWDS